MDTQINKLKAEISRRRAEIAECDEINRSAPLSSRSSYPDFLRQKILEMEAGLRLLEAKESGGASGYSAFV